MRYLELARFCTAESSRVENPAEAAEYNSTDSAEPRLVSYWSVVPRTSPVWQYLGDRVFFQVPRLRQLLWFSFWRHRWHKSSYSSQVVDSTCLNGTIFFFLEAAAVMLCWGVQGYTAGGIRHYYKRQSPLPYDLAPSCTSLGYSVGFTGTLLAPQKACNAAGS